jgi:hypothetical protein
MSKEMVVRRKKARADIRLLRYLLVINSYCSIQFINLRSLQVKC